jgi:hypothetical protein
MRKGPTPSGSQHMFRDALVLQLLISGDAYRKHQLALLPYSIDLDFLIYVEHFIIIGFP